MKACFLFVAIIWGSCRLCAQEITPLLQGSLKISIKKGIMDCDFMLSNIPVIKNYVILINSGMNIRYFRDSISKQNYAYSRIFSDTLSSESFQYYFPDVSGTGRFLPNSFQVRYIGAFPVVIDTIEAPTSDWRGNVAFNGRTIRADGLQSNWYPVLYDISKKTYYEKIECKLKVECEDCSAIFLNGNKIVNGNSVFFINKKNNELILFAGDYKTYERDGNCYLNFTSNDKVENVDYLFDVTNKIKLFYEQITGIPYNGNINFINAKQATKRTGFGFFVYPTVTFVNAELENLSTLARKKYYASYVSHELGHYYFGELKQFNSEFGRVINEGFTEYISLQAIRYLLSDSTYYDVLSKKLDDIKGKQITPFFAIRNTEDFNEDYYLYVYSYAPVILTTIEKKIGIKRMWRWINILLTSNSKSLNYKDFIETLSIAINDETIFKDIKEQILESQKTMPSDEILSPSYYRTK